MRNDPDKTRSERARTESPESRELTEAQLEHVVGGDGGSATLRRPI